MMPFLDTGYSQFLFPSFPFARLTLGGVRGDDQLRENNDEPTAGSNMDQLPILYVLLLSSAIFPRNGF